MGRPNRKIKIHLMAMAFITVSLLGVILPTSRVRAASGNIYTCTIHPTYSHPVSGAVEDAGGTDSYTTGQGMVEGAVSSTGLLEETDDGQYYLTVRFSLIDYSTGHSFLVQNVGDGNFNEVTASVTATGSDNNGTTSDFCIPVQSESCIVRVSMNVTPMGRDVIFYIYPTDYVEGNTSGMTATHVTEASKKDEKPEQETEQKLEQQTQASSENTPEAETSEPGGTSEQTENKLPASGITSTGAESDQTTTKGTGGLSLSTADHQTSIQEPDTQSETELVNMKASATGKQTATYGMGQLILILTVSLTLSGLILMLIAILIICLLRKNWRRWGNEDED